ncbi:hypothetical protein DVH24_033196 [Malus domestica]|uniref:Uncharacterized protein n=1 Tax=Malus domestica TaxID=3750 RepID=A0A498J9Y9_MALDO|nr:hypothetical protein DVH24_033196 [Malus domestica]
MSFERPGCYSQHPSHQLYLSIRLSLLLNLYHERRELIFDFCLICMPIIDFLQLQSPGHNIVRFGPRPHGFVSGNSHENFPMDHPSWDRSRPNSLNLGVPTNSEAGELTKRPRAIWRSFVVQLTGCFLYFFRLATPGYPKELVNKWSQKEIRRKTIGTGRAEVSAQCAKQIQELFQRRFVTSRPGAHEDVGPLRGVDCNIPHHPGE